MVSHDLLRVEVKQRDLWGWIYACLRAPITRRTIRATQYEHVVKHIETQYLGELPVAIPADAPLLKHCDNLAKDILRCRNEAFAKIKQAETLFERQFPAIIGELDQSTFIHPASQVLFTGRRRFDAPSHTPEKAWIEKRLAKSCVRWMTLREAGCGVWLPNRFRRIPLRNGVELINSSQLFEINPDGHRRISSSGIVEGNNGFVKPGWLMLSRSGGAQTQLGQVAMATEYHTGKVISDHVIRISAAGDILPGYLGVAIDHPTLGRPRVRALAYGLSVQHIDEGDLKEFRIPRLRPEVEQKISQITQDAFALWMDADRCENRLARLVEVEIKQHIVGS